MLTKQIMTFDEFWKTLKEKGYQYGFDAADNAYFGYKLAYELEESNVARTVVKGIVRDIANDYAFDGLVGIAAEIRSLIGE